MVAKERESITKERVATGKNVMEKERERGNNRDGERRRIIC